MDRRRLMRAAGAEFSLDDYPEGMLTYDHVVALWQHAYDLTGDTNLALHVGEWAPHGARSVMFFLCGNAASVGAAFETFAEFQASLDNTTIVTVGEELSSVYLSIEKKGGHRAALQELEWLLAFMFCTVRAATGVSFRPLRVDIAAPAPEDASEHARVFGCQARFGQEKSRLWFGRSDWQLPCRSADIELRRVLEHHARTMAAEVPSLDSLRDAVRALVLARLDSGHPSIEEAAKALRVSVRTLQRRLSAEGVSYAEIVDSARAAIARGLLRQPHLSLAEIAQSVGFSEQSSFTRAFKKWTGTTPAEFRRSGRHSTT